MAAAERIRPKLPHLGQTPQCCVPVPDSSLWSESYRQRRHRKFVRSGWDAERCGRGGSVTIDGDTYCGQHAAILALAILLGEDVDWSQPGDMAVR